MASRMYLYMTVTFASTLLVACVPERDYQPRVTDGDKDRGRAALLRYECGVCHVIPGIPDAVGKVGPALDNYSRRSYVAGKFPNEPETLARWIVDAPSMAPRTAMPAIAMSDQEAKDMAAYLYDSGWP
jgi:mono/diheme cytochrome c family protein